MCLLPVQLQSELSCHKRIQEDGEKEMCIASLQANVQLLQQEQADTHVQVGRDSDVDKV